MPRFVVLKHEMPADQDRPTHWDFMLEADDTLWTWALIGPPSVGESQTAERLPDHRLAYLEYEGPVSGGRGSVKRWDQGTYETEQGVTGELLVVVRGERLTGRIRLTQEAETNQRWRFVVEPAT